MAKTSRQKPAAKLTASKRLPRAKSKKPLKAPSVARVRKPKTPSNAELLRLARKNPPPASWFSQDEEKPF